jgi:nucleotide-binding universal stress UspA family protein
MAETNASSPAPIVVAIDFDGPSVFALRRAAEIFRRSPAAELEVLHVLRARSEDEGRDRAEVKRTVDRVREFVAAKLGDPSTLAGRHVGIHVRWGDVPLEIVRFAGDADAQLIVVGSHGRHGLAKQILGSTSERILELSSIAVVIASGDPSREAPTIEPPCPLCVTERRRSGGARWWCARHGEHHARAHSYSFRQEWSSGSHDSNNVTPTGV